jgi:hypothetical protein
MPTVTELAGSLRLHATRYTAENPRSAYWPKNDRFCQRRRFRDHSRHRLFGFSRHRHRRLLDADLVSSAGAAITSAVTFGGKAPSGEKLSRFLIRGESGVGKDVIARLRLSNCPTPSRDRLRYQRFGAESAPRQKRARPERGRADDAEATKLLTCKFSTTTLRRIRPHFCTGGMMIPSLLIRGWGHLNRSRATTGGLLAAKTRI